MNQRACVFRMQWSLFKEEKGMLVFYLLCIATVGILIPVFSESISTNLILASILTIAFLKPIAADALAGERERRTLESLLSASVRGKDIILGKIRFCICFSFSFFTAILGLTAATHWIMRGSTGLSIWQWFCVISSALLMFAFISVAGCLISATSSDMRMAHGRISWLAYPFGLLLIIYISVVLQNEILIALVAGVLYVLVCICVGGGYGRKVYQMHQCDYFENIKQKTNGTLHTQMDRVFCPKRQFSIVLCHELRYLLALKQLLLSFGLLCFAPLCVICIGKYFFGEINLYYGVLLTALMMPRIPSNLIAYSVGGEKVYKTGESLLAAPLHMGIVFLAKGMVPILVSTIMLLLSSGITLVGVNVVGRVLEGGAIYHYTKDQFLLLFFVGVLSCAAMVLLTGLFCVNLKTPRQGLYVSCILGIVFVLPPSAIVFMAQDRFFWSLLYGVVLLIGNVIGGIFILNKCQRTKITSKL